MPSLRAGASVHSEQHLVSLVPFPEGHSLPSPRPCPMALSSQLAALPALCQHSSPFQAEKPKLAQLSVAGEGFGSKCDAGGGGWREGRERIPVEILDIVVSINCGK